MSQSLQEVQEVFWQTQTHFAVPASLPAADAEASVTNTSGDTQLSQTSQPLPSFTSGSGIEPLPLPTTVPALSNIDSGLPPKEIVQLLVDLFFELIYPWVPLFCKASFMASLHSPERQILLHGIVIVAFRFWRLPEPPAMTRESYMRASREQILLNTVDTCSLVSTQALALLAVDAIGQGPGPRTLNIMAMLLTATQQLGLARSPSSTNGEPNIPLVRNEDPGDGLDLSSTESEERRRLFWIIYGLDRFSSVSHGQAGGIDTKSIKIRYPANDENWGQTGTPKWFQGALPIDKIPTHLPANLWHFYIDLLVLVDKSNLLLTQPVNLFVRAQCQDWQSSFRRLEFTLSSWFENLPREVREPPEIFNPVWIMVHATFHLYGLRWLILPEFSQFC